MSPMNDGNPLCERVVQIRARPADQLRGEEWLHRRSMVRQIPGDGGTILHAGHKQVSVR